MPRQSRIDAPGALHHVMIRGIDRTVIFWGEWIWDGYWRKSPALLV